MRKNTKYEGWVIGRQKQTMKFHTLLLFTKEEGVITLKVRIPSKLTVQQPPALLQYIGAEVVLAGGVQPVLSSYVVLESPLKDPISMEQMGFLYVWSELLSLLLPQGEAQERVFDLQNKVMEILSTTEFTNKLLLVAIYRLFVVLGLFSCGQRCISCQQVFSKDDIFFACSREELDVVCFRCEEPARMIRIPTPLFHWMRYGERSSLQEMFGVAIDDDVLRKLSEVLYVLIHHTVGRPLKSASFFTL